MPNSTATVATTNWTGLGFRPFLVEDIPIDGLVLRLCSEGELVLRCLYGVLQASLGGFADRSELLAVCDLLLARRGRTFAVLDGVLGVAAVSKTHGGIFSDFAAHILYRILITYFCHNK